MLCTRGLVSSRASTLGHASKASVSASAPAEPRSQILSRDSKSLVPQGKRRPERLRNPLNTRALTAVWGARRRQTSGRSRKQNEPASPFPAGPFQSVRVSGGGPLRTDDPLVDPHDVISTNHRHSSRWTASVLLSCILRREDRHASPLPASCYSSDLPRGSVE